ncbi:MAG: hypothetical protein ACTSU5_14190 [Promethearchaeota archaeon]
MLLPTSVVGSFPRENTLEAMAEVFRDEIAAGIDYPTYPQLVDMIDQFLEPLSKAQPDTLEKRGKEWFLLRPFEVPSEPVALEYGQFVLDYFKENPAERDEIAGTKACLTGPFTLSGAIVLDDELAAARGVKPFIFKEPRAIMDRELLETCARLMASIAREYSRMGFDIITMDEPTLSLVTGRRMIWKYKTDYAVDVLNQALSGIGTRSSIHVCGRVPPLLKETLLASNVDIVDHEFADGENLDAYTRVELEEAGKTLAFGVVDTKVARIPGEEDPGRYVESVDYLEAFIRKGVDLFGAQNLFIKPDCGMGGMKGTFEESFAYEVAIKKLSNMVEATRRVRSSL